jgi:hypothetical protein
MNFMHIAINTDILLLTYMGNSNSTWDKSIKQDYVAAEEINHPVLGSLRLFRHKLSGQEVFMKRIEAVSLGSYNEAKYKQRVALNDPRFVRVIDMGIVKKGGGSCSGPQ